MRCRWEVVLIDVVAEGRTTPPSGVSLCGTARAARGAVGTDGHRAYTLLKLSITVMHGRRLATTEEIVAISSPDSDRALEALHEWTAENDVTLKTVPVGEDIDEVYDDSRATLGVTLGGDGTFLEGIRVFAPRGVPLLGVNTGTLAFLARVAPSDLQDALTEVLRGRASVEGRQQVEVDAKGVSTTGINDVMIQHVPPENPVDRKITRLHLFADDEYVGMYEGTGMAVSTPTGSTGISLSANGPIHYPQNNFTLQVVPLHTHRMGVRPLTVGADTDLTVVTEERANLLVDGGRSYTLLGGDAVVEITGADDRAQVVRTSYDDHFFTAVASKLGWGLRDGADTGPRESLPAPAERAHPAATGGGVAAEALPVAVEAAESAGEPLRDLHGRVESIEYKSDKADVVTEADYQSERVIAAVIDNEFPDHAIRSEEDVQRPGTSDYTWLVDPLDGTGNFAHGNPNYSISIALLDGETPVMGVVHAPETGETFAATATGPAYENENPLSTTDRDSLDESMLLSGYDPDGTFLSHFYHETRGVRRLGSAALSLCYLASGTADAVWEYDTYPWDVAAGLVVARAAGARITDAAGEDYRLRLDGGERTELLGSNGPLHPALLEHLRDDRDLRHEAGAPAGPDGEAE
jgi:myo-inositol-1(or 4)-monophosphatase